MGVLVQPSQATRTYRIRPAGRSCSGSQRAIGFGVLGDMISATVLGIFFVPLFYLWVKALFSTRAGSARDAGCVNAECKGSSNKSVM